MSEIGKQAVHRLNDLGVIIDVSQMSTKALEQVAQLSRTPMVASHSAPRAAVDIPRNLSDKELQLIKHSGGVVQIVGFSAYLRPLSQPTQDKLNALRARFDLPPLPNLAMALMPGDAIIAAWPEHKFGEYASALYAILDEEPKATLKDLGMPSTTPCARSASTMSAWRRTSTTAAASRAGTTSAKYATSPPN